MHITLKTYPSLVLFLFTLATNAAENRIWIKAQVENAPVQLFFDTAATHSVLFRSTAVRLGLKLAEPPSGFRADPGKTPASWTEPCRVQIGPLVLRERFAVVDLPPNAQTEAEGALSWRWLSGAIFIFEGSQRSLAITNSVPPTVFDWPKFALQKDAQILGFNVVGPSDSKSSVYIDTGSEGGVEVNQQIWNRLLSAEPSRPMTVDAYFVPGAGLVVVEEIWVKELEVGSLKIHNVPVRRENAAVASALMPNHAATLGLYALRRFNLVIDYPNSTAFAQTNSQPPQQYPHNRLGAAFVPPDDRSSDLIAHVVPGSPAASSGIQTRDILLRIGDLDATQWRTDPRLTPIGRFWRQPPGTRLQLTLRRAGNEYTTFVTLRNILGPQE